MPQDKTRWLDITSMGLSGLCVVHCLALPFLVAALPFLGVFTQNDIVHQVLVLIAAPLTGLAFWRSRAWQKPEIAALMVAGLALLAAAAFIAELQPYEVAVSVLGALSLAGAHLLNYLGGRIFHRHTSDCACPNS
ncbi:MAG: MerC domain-containing protein [Asticcacaulis sp.]